MYTQHTPQHEPTFSSFLHAPYRVVDTHVNFVDGTGNKHLARDYQKEAVLTMHAKRSSILKFQKAVVQFQQECNKWRQGGFDVSMNISLPIKQAIVKGGYNFSLSVKDQQVDDSEIEYGDDSMWFYRRTFYTMTRENKSTATLIVIEKLVHND
jgi:hypothetical protein